MPPKAKPKAAKPEVRMSERLTQTWHHHPLVSLGTIATVVTIIVSVAPWVTGYIKNFETVESAKRANDAVMVLIEAHKVNDARTQAFTTVQLLRQETVTQRNRVNDCEIKKDKKDKMTTLERSACAQYQQEFDDATRRFNDARKTAMDSTREK